MALKHKKQVNFPTGTSGALEEGFMQIKDSFRDIYDDLTRMDSENQQVQYFGDRNTDGSWRIRVNGNNLVFERRESGAWVEKSAIVP